MDNNLNKGGFSQSWTDPITGEIYPRGNPHADIQSSRVVGAASKTGVYNDPLPPGAVPQPAQRMPQIQQVQPMQHLQPVQQAQPVYRDSGITKFCEHCGSVLVKEAVICPTCGCQVAPIRQTAGQQIPIQQAPGQQIPVNQVPGQPIQVIVNNIVQRGAPKDKTVALLLCIFLGHLGVHRFYEGRIGTGILWMFTLGLFGIGWFADVIRIAVAPNPYYVNK